jgi:hypothetical protein
MESRAGGTPTIPADSAKSKMTKNDRYREPDMAPSPVWFLDGNPIAGYSKLKDGVRLLFWSGQSFEEPGLAPQ